MATQIRGLIFDFDGLILDTEVPGFEVWREILEEAELAGIPCAVAMVVDSLASFELKVALNSE